MNERPVGNSKVAIVGVIGCLSVCVVSLSLPSPHDCVNRLQKNPATQGEVTVEDGQMASLL